MCIEKYTPTVLPFIQAFVLDLIFTFIVLHEAFIRYIHYLECRAHPIYAKDQC